MMIVVNNNSLGSGSFLFNVIVGNGNDIQNMFMILFVVQIKNQDLLLFSDLSVFVNQLMQLSQMEVLQKLVDQGGVGNSMM